MSHKCLQKQTIKGQKITDIQYSKYSEAMIEGKK